MTEASRLAWVALLGLMGVLSRYGLDRFAAARDWPAPAGTFAVNALGCLCAGFLFGLPSNFFSAEWRVPMMTGFLGGFTTYSAFSVQVLSLASGEGIRIALLYGITTPAVAILCAWLGRRISLGLF